VTNVATEIVIQQTEAGGGNFYEFEPDVYEALVANIEEVDNPFEEDKTQLEFTFEIPGYENEDGTVASKRAWANPVWNSKSKLWGWASAILGVEPAKGEAFRTSALIGKPCRVTMNAGTNQKGERIVKVTDVLGPKVAANGKAKPGLVSRMKADGCCVPSCKGELSAYDAEGNGFCAKHAPDGD
jgi:hypothetical protein